MSGEQDILSTAVGGLALLYCGYVDAAKLAGDYLTALMDNQPAGPEHILLKTTANNEIITEFDDEDDPAQWIVSFGEQHQWYHAPSLAAALLVKLAEVTGSSKRLETAQDYVNFVDSCAGDRYTSEKSGFFGLAAALLYGATGNPNYRRITTSVASALVEDQLDNGSWLKASMSENITSDVVDATAENMICMKHILESLSTGE